MFIEDSPSTLVVFINVLKTGSDQPVGMSIGHKTGPVQCKKLVVNESDENRLNRWSN